MLFDFKIRQLTKDQKSLDDVMRFLYKEYYQKKKRGFTEEELRKAFETVAGSSLAEEFEYIYKVNVFGVAALNRVVLPFMQSGGHVVTISSMGGVQGTMKFAGLSAYSSSKGAVITLSELLAEEYKEQGISFNVLALGAVNTEMLQEAFPGYEAPLSPKEMADYIFDFALNGNKYFNGKVLQVSSSTP